MKLDPERYFWLPELQSCVFRENAKNFCVSLHWKVVLQSS
jgi:hypothetical protein